MSYKTKRSEILKRKKEYKFIKYIYIEKH
jgi:hypothetical protein